MFNIQCKIHCLRWSIIIHYQKFTTSAVNTLLRVLFSSLSLRRSPLGFSFSKGRGKTKKSSKPAQPFGSSVPLGARWSVHKLPHVHSLLHRYFEYISGVMSLWYNSYFYSSSKRSAFHSQILVAVLACCTVLEVIIFPPNCTFSFLDMGAFPLE